MSEQKHTKGPWVAEGRTFISEKFLEPGAIIIRAPAEQHWVAYVLPFNDSAKDEQQVADAEFIVRACNNYEEVLSALKDLVDCTEETFDNRHELLAAREAIDSAEGRESEEEIEEEEE